MSAQIRAVSGDAALEQIRALLHEYAEELGVDLGFQQFDAELAALPGDYRPPRGGLWLAMRDEAPAGCVALRPLAADVAEMKRLYVRRAQRGRGLGRLLAQAAIAFARDAGHRRLRLDTLANMPAAHALYASLGFRPVAAYCENPLPGAQWLERDLAGADA